MMESTGMSGRLPVSFVQVNPSHGVNVMVQTTRNTCPGVLGELLLKPPTAAYPIGVPTAGELGSRAMPMIGRLGRTALPPVTFTQLACACAPVPRLKPIWTLPSLVPAMATLWYLGEYLTWLIYERLPRVPLVRFAVIGLLVTTHWLLLKLDAVPLTVSQTRVVPASRCPQPEVEPAAAQSSPPGMPPWKRWTGRTKDWVSLVQLPLQDVQLAPGKVQLWI